ncbi:ArsR/SmtB family transcription factor [Tumebacillus flagellatus]|uniref:HTH arsR-type domain-containing protein n=1 Tax=Tumebacillus flagellatus TaxID=1157490 RepID=A0A074LMG1_9BACL|nr:DUF5937 family protein [Tumebacillus flagellatus]KEO82314.1 hypothetical protein EL26_16160 [Tumebacillus flagellatus]
MTIHFRLRDLPPERVVFTPSPAQEALQSLHILHLPKRFPLHTSWVLRTRKQLSAELKAELHYFEPMWGDNAIPLIWDMRVADMPADFAGQLNWLREQPLPWYADEMLGGYSLKSTDLVERPELLQQAFFSDLKNDPVRHRERFLAMFARYWQEAFADTWQDMQTLIRQDIERRLRVMTRKSVLHGLVNLSRYLLVNFKTRTATVTYNTLDTEVQFPPEKRLYLMPSYFTWPFLLLGVSGEHPLIAYPLMQQQEEGSAPVPPDRLLELLKAAGDATRLQILQLAAQEPRSTRQLAGLLSISEATASKHLKQLQEAGLVTPKRQSHYVFYHFDRNGLSDLLLGLTEIFPD